MVPLITYALLGTSRQLGVGPVALVSLLVEVGLKGALTEEECPEYYAQKNDTSLASEADWQLQSELCPDEYAQLAFLTSFLMGLFQIGAGEGGAHPNRRSASPALALTGANPNRRQAEPALTRTGANPNRR